MISLRSFVFVSVFLLARLCCAFSIVADISPNRINIDSEFQGQRILVFGALVKPSKNVIAIVHGPSKDIKVSKKIKTFGIWINGQKSEFKDVPQFYSISYVKDRYQDIARVMRKEFDVFLKNKSELLDAFIKHKKEMELYQINDDVEIIDDHLFRCSINLPSSIQKGVYNVEILSLDSDKIVGINLIPLFINKVGLESFLFDMHVLHPLLYGFVAIFGALIVGWMGWFLPKK